MIQLKNISKTYKSKKAGNVKAIDKVSLGFLDKGFVFILGKSGSGKTTLLNVLGGLDKIDSGNIIIDNKDTAKFKSKDWDSYRNSYLGFIFQDYNVLPDFNVKDNILLALKLQKEKVSEEKLDNILERVGLSDKKLAKVNELSGGQKQRVAIARALIKDPKLILADEPTGALDSKTGEDIFNLLKELSEDHLVICVSHDVEDAKKYADRIIEIKDGQVIEDVSKKTYQNELSESGLTKITESSLSVKKGYKLKEKDFAYIQSLIDNSKDFSVQINNGVNATTNEFVATNEFEIEEEIKNSNAKFISKKSRLPLGNELKMAFSSLKHKKIRLATTFIIGLVGVTLLGTLDTLSSFDSFDTLQRSISTMNGPITAIDKTFLNAQKNESNIIENVETMFFDEDKEFIEDKINQKTFGIINENPTTKEEDLPIYGTFMKDPSSSQVSGSYDNIFWSHRFYGYSYYSDDILKEFNNFTLIGESPNEENEVVVPSYFFEMYKKYGVKAYTFNEEESSFEEVTDYKVSKIEQEFLDYSNENSLYYRFTFVNNAPYNVTLKENDTRVGYFKIVGILDTELNSTYLQDEYEEHLSKNETNELNNVINDINNYLNLSFHRLPLLFLKDNDISKISKNRVYTFGDTANFQANTMTGKLNKIYDSSNIFDSLKDEIIWVGKDERTELKDNEVIINPSNPYFLRVSKYLGDRRYSMKYNCENLMENRIKYDFTEMDLYSINFNFYQSRLHNNFDERFHGAIDLITMPYGGLAMYIWNELPYREMVKKYPFIKDWLIERGGYGGYSNHNYEAEISWCFYYAYYLMSGSYMVPRVSAAIENETWFRNQNGYYKNTLLKDEKSGIECIKDLNRLLAIEREETDSSWSWDRVYETETFNLVFETRDADGEELKRDYNVVGFIFNDRILKDSSDYLIMNGNTFNDLMSCDQRPTITYESIGTYKYLLTPTINKDTNNSENIASLLESDYQFQKDIKINEDSEYALYTNLLKNGINNEPVDMIKFSIKANYLSTLNTLSNTLNQSKTIVLSLGIVFAVLSAAIFINYISTSVAFKKKEIGILRALGAKKGNVVSIFLYEALFISLVTFAISSVLAVTGTIFINTLLTNMSGITISILTFDPIAFAYMGAVSIGIGLLATIVSTISLLKKKTIDIVRAE